MQEPFGNAVHACTKVNLRGKRVAIIGCGTIGLFAIAMARAMGARMVIGVEPMRSHTEMARRLGADVVVSPRKTTETSYVHDEGITRAIHDAHRRRGRRRGAGDVRLQRGARTPPSRPSGAAATSSSSA